MTWRFKSGFITHSFAHTYHKYRNSELVFKRYNDTAIQQSPKYTHLTKQHIHQHISSDYIISDAYQNSVDAGCW